MSQPVLTWIVLAVLCGIAELLMPFFGVVFAAGACLFAAIAAALGLEWAGQTIVFTIALLGGLIGLRPKLLNRISASAPGVPSRTEALIGKSGKIIEPIAGAAQPGRISVEGEDWAARSEQHLPVGSTARVVGADGIVLIVNKE